MFHPKVFQDLCSSMFHRKWRATAHRFGSSDRRLRVETLEDRQLLAIMPHLLKDINEASTASFSSQTQFTAVGGLVFFAADDGTSGIELWKSDGTEAGTVRVKDIRPGADGAFSPYQSPFLNLNGTLYFSASDGTSGVELWKSDGTEAGTVRVKDIRPGEGSSNASGLTNVNGTLYFSASDGTNGVELWKSDGTESGTVQVKDIRPGADNGYPFWLTNVNGTLVFSASDQVEGIAFDFDLWTSDGTEGGTVRVKDIQPGIESVPRYLTDVNGTVYFNSDGSLWKSDGTELGTVRVKDILPNTIGTIRSLVKVEETLYFIAADETGLDLWKSDGSEDGTEPVTDFGPNAIIDSLTNVNGTLYFSAAEGGNDFELWKSDGTAAGTIPIKDIWSIHLTNVNGALYFSADDGTNGLELWTSDGTEAGTVLVADLVPGSAYSAPRDFIEVAGKLFFTAADDAHGRELWVADLTAPNDDRNQDGLIDVRDIDALCVAVAGGTVTRDELEGFWSRQNTGPGDSNFDHLFNSSDLVLVFQKGKYESNARATWSEGDWNCDGLFDSGDLVAAFQRGWYEVTPNALVSASSMSLRKRLPTTGTR
jgi:ELWxxDGT repeat protein